MSSEAQGLTDQLHSFVASNLDEAQQKRWRDFASGSPCAHYHQDPAWAQVERHGADAHIRRPYFFWMEHGGELCLTALGIRRALPMPGRVFWEFNNGPTLLDGDLLNSWLPWLSRTLGRTAARIRIQPAVALDESGDHVETLLERYGFVRRRMLGGWATLKVDLTRGEDEIIASFRSATRAKIRKSMRLGIMVRAENSAVGLSALSELAAEMALRAPIRPTDHATLTSISDHWLSRGAKGNILVARFNAEPLAAILIIVHRETAHLDMMPSTRRYGKLPTSHLLLWEAMRWAKKQGCASFDLGGWSCSASPGDALWGVNLFKRGFAPEEPLCTSVAIHERVVSSLVVAASSAVRRIQSRRPASDAARGD